MKLTELCATHGKGGASIRMMLVVAILLAALAVPANANSTADGVIETILSLPENTFQAMKSYLEVIDSLDPMDDERRLALEQPGPYLAANYGIDIGENAFVFTVLDKAVEIEPGLPDWLNISPPVGEGTLMPEVIAMGGRLILTVQMLQTEDAAGAAQDPETSHFLQLLSSLEDSLWENAREYTLRLNSRDASVEARGEFLNEPREALVFHDLLIPSLTFQIAVADIELGEEYGAVFQDGVAPGLVPRTVSLGFEGETAFIFVAQLF